MIAHELRLCCKIFLGLQNGSYEGTMRPGVPWSQDQTTALHVGSRALIPGQHGVPYCSGMTSARPMVLCLTRLHPSACLLVPYVSESLSYLTSFNKFQSLVPACAQKSFQNTVTRGSQLRDFQAEFSYLLTIVISC